jgi:hypothetical protein
MVWDPEDEDPHGDTGDTLRYRALIFAGVMFGALPWACGVLWMFGVI